MGLKIVEFCANSSQYIDSYKGKIQLFKKLCLYFEYNLGGISNSKHSVDIIDIAKMEALLCLAKYKEIFCIVSECLQCNMAFYLFVSLVFIGLVVKN